MHCIFIKICHKFYFCHNFETRRKNWQIIKVKLFTSFKLLIFNYLIYNFIKLLFNFFF